MYYVPIHLIRIMKSCLCGVQCDDLTPIFGTTWTMDMDNNNGSGYDDSDNENDTNDVDGNDEVSNDMYNVSIKGWLSWHGIM